MIPEAQQRRRVVLERMPTRGGPQALCRRDSRAVPRLAGAGALLGLLLAAVLAPPVFARAAVQARFYVDPAGSDRDPGTLRKPFRTIYRARRAVRLAKARGMSGDIVVYLRQGRHSLTRPLVLSASDSGEGGSRVVYRNFPGERPVLSGGREIRGWVLVNRKLNVWGARTPRGLRTRQLYVDGARAVRARGTTPKFWIKAPFGYIAGNDSLARWEEPDALELVFTKNAGGERGLWLEPRCGVHAIIGTSIVVDEPCWTNVVTPRPGPFAALPANAVPTAIENAVELLDEPGEWFQSERRGRIYYIPRLGQRMEDATVIAPRLERLVRGQGVHDVDFRGLGFEHATWLGPSGPQGFAEAQANFTLTGVHAATFQGTCSVGRPPGTCPFMAWTKTPGNVTFHAARSVRFVDNVFAHLGAVGLNFDHGSRDNLVRGNVFTDISASAIQIGDADNPRPDRPSELNVGNQILDNYVYDAPREYHGGVAIWAAYTRGLTVAHNRIERVPYTGISIGWGHGLDPSVVPNASARNRVVGNLVADAVQRLADGGGIYVSGPQGPSPNDGLLIEGNVIRDLRQPDVHYSVYLDAGSRFVALRRNVLLNDSGSDVGGCLPFGDFAVEENFLLHPQPSWPCGAPSGATSFRANTIVASLADAPREIVEAAGPRPPYRSLVEKPIP